MNALTITLRRGSAPVAVPVMIALGCYAGTRDSDSWSLDWGWASGQLQQHGVLLVPLAAAIAAWDSARGRRDGAAELFRTHPRSPLAAAVLTGTSALLPALAGWIATLLVMVGTVRSGSSPYWSIVGLGAFVFVPAVLIGVLSGRYLPRYLAPPLTAVAMWMALALAPAAGIRWWPC